MRSVFCRAGLGWTAALVLGAPLCAQSARQAAPQSNGTFRWIDFHSQKDQNIVAWVARSLQIENWTAIREIGVEYDAALVVTSDRTNPAATPGSGMFSVWSASLTSHVVAPLVTGANLRWFDPIRFADGTPEEWPVLYDNCLNCAPNTYFTSLYYDLRSHTWSTRWMTGGHGVAVWNVNHPAGVNWSQIYAVMTEGDGHVALYTWNHFDYGKSKPPDDFIYRYDVDPFSSLARTVMISGKDMAAAKLRMCRGQDAVQGLERGQDSPLCQQLTRQQPGRQPVTTPPANNRGQSAPPGSPR